MVIKSNSPFAGAEERSALWQALPQILAVCVKNVLLLGYGMTLGFPTILIPSISGNNKDEIFSLGQEGISWIGSINLICVPVGCLLSGLITQPIGRKRAMQYVNVPFLVSWLLLYFSNDLWQVFFALALTGLAGGLMEAPVLTYVAEITQPHLRGMLSSTSSMAVTAGTVVQFFLGSFFNWRTVALSNIITPVIAFALLYLIPETPMWLISKGRYTDAQKSLAWLRGWATMEEVDKEFKELRKHLGESGIDNSVFEEHANNSQHVRVRPTTLETIKLFAKKTFVYPYTLVSFAFFLGHFGGLTPLQTYAIKIFSALKVPIDTYYATVVLGTVQLLGCVTCVSLVHYVGKRWLTFLSLFSTGVCFGIVATYAFLANINFLTDSNMLNANITIVDQPEHLNKFTWIPVTFLIAAAFGSCIGIRLLPWILTGEVFSNETRAIGSGLASATSYIFGFLCNKTFFKMVSLLTLPGTFWSYSLVCLIGLVILYFVLPETEGKSLHLIQEHFSGISRLGNKVYRRNNESDDNCIIGKENEAFDEEFKKEESKL